MFKVYTYCSLRIGDRLSPKWLWLAMSLPLPAFGQVAGTISGMVQGPDGVPVEFATLTLHRPIDSTVVKSEYSDAKGTFRLLAQPGRYLVSATQVGFVRYWSGPVEVSAAGLLLPTLTLRTSTATALGEVKVLGQRPLFERQADRTVVNVEGTTLAAGNTALDVLSRSPGVTVGGDDAIALRGKQGLLVLIDGRRQPMSGTELADYLRALPAEQLKNIELITNPPASYDAQGGAGVIAINLKKDQRQGFNGNARLSYGHGQFGRFTTGGDLNYRYHKINSFGSYTYADRRTYFDLRSHRNFYEQGQLTGTSDASSFLPIHVKAHTWKAGLDYTPTRRTTLGIATTGLTRRDERTGTDAVTLADATGQPTTVLNTTSSSQGRFPNATGTINLRQLFTDSASSPVLTADVNYATYRTHRQQNLTALAEATAVPTHLTVNQEGRLDLKTAQFDYVHPLAHQQQLSLGAKISRVHTDNDIVFYQQENGISILDTTQTNNFHYDERINAAYATYERKGTALMLVAGLRGEHTATSSVQDVGDLRVERSYFQLFPSAALTYKVSDRHELLFSLSRRIERPDYTELNPFRSYVSATAFRSGNPFLQPATTYSTELTHTFLQKYSTSLNYSNTHNSIANVTQPVALNSRLIVNREVNLGTLHYVGLTLTAPMEPRRGWTIYNTAVVFYQRYSDELTGANHNLSRVAFTLSSAHTLALGQGWSADLNARYESTRLSGFQVLRPTGELTAGVQKSLWQGQGSLKLNVTDIFHTSFARVISTYDTYVDHYALRTDTRVATLAFSYRFGNAKLAPAVHHTDGAADEKRRAGAQ
jgi:ferric enterobactin receptor